MHFESVIGLEIHAQLLTDSKIFCGCSARFGAPPNTQICPVCLGLPGALPVLNRRAVDYAIRAAATLGCTIHERSVFARKNYFYPDLPKGYQISQYEQPLATDGQFHGVGIVRVHLEEDAGKLLHEGFVDSSRNSYVDFNRSGVPLIEIVTRPDLRSAAAAADFFSRLRDVLVWIDVNDGNMEEGSLRCDANVSVRAAGSTTLGTKAEVKNLNSFRFLEGALAHEIDRQIDLVSGGGRVVQETRLWDAAHERTVSMRTKEEAHDYRYFPEPDLPPLVVGASRVDAIRDALPELADVRRRRFVEQYALPEYDAAQLTQSRATAEYFEATVGAGAPPKAASNWVMQSGVMPLEPSRLASLIGLVHAGTISSSTAKTVLEKMLATGATAETIVAADGLTQISDESQVAGLIADVLSSNGDAVAQYRAGKTAAFGYLVGQVMKAAGGRANPRRINELLKKALAG